MGFGRDKKIYNIILMRLLEGAISNAPWIQDPRSKIPQKVFLESWILDLGSRTTLKYFKVAPGGPNRLNGALYFVSRGPRGAL